MSRRPPEEIIAAHINYINTRSKIINDKPVYIKSSFLRSFGSDSKNIALEYLLLNKPDESKSWFEKSAEYYYSSKQIKENFKEKYTGKFDYRKHFTETVALHMISSAILSENIVMMKEISKDILKSPPYKSLRYDLTLEHVKSLAMLIIDSAEFYPPQINKFKELEDKYAKRLSGASNGVAKSLLAIYNSENESLMEGINQILRQFFYRVKRSKERPICVEAIMLLKLAEIKGMIIELDGIEQKYRKYIPECIFEK